MPDANDILTFWFGSSSDPDYGTPRPAWFRKDPEFDQAIRQRFLATLEQAERGELQAWTGSALSCLALIILLDQFPRNLFRGTPRSFATDPQALATARQAIIQGFDQQVLPVQRWFFYLPFEHSENLADQQRCLKLFEGLRSDPASQDSIQFAQRHWQIIQQFGRFPHRNSILGRESTPAELAFLQQPGSGF